MATYTDASDNTTDYLADNSNLDCRANLRYVIAVGAVNETGKQSYYSESGANVLISAPSSDGKDTRGIVTTDLSGELGYSDTSYFREFGGTSAATPVISGVAALLLEVNPDLTWRDVKKILALSAYQNDATDTEWIQNGAGHWINHKYGFGVVDAEAAVRLAYTWENLPEAGL